MKTTISIAAAAAFATISIGAQAQDISGRVISSTPVVQQVQVPRQVCNNQPVVVQQPRSGAGAVIGAIAGGVLGNTIGHGGGRALATGVGMMGGALVGNQIEGGGTALQSGTTCTTQTFYENRTVGYDVTYEYGGRQYTVQMPNDPGPNIRLQVGPAGASSAPSGSYPLASAEAGVSAPAGTQSVPAVVASSTMVYPAAYPTAVPMYPAVYPGYYPAYPAYSYYPPIGISLGFGFGGGGWGGHHHRGGGRWR
jgi:uncharacterized protein YcfJ